MPGLTKMRSLLALTLAFAACAAAAPYPHKSVTLVTHSSPGGGSDVFLRALAKHLGPRMGANLAVENVSGGSGARAVSRVAQAPADGSVLYATTPTYIQTTLLSKPPQGYDSLMPVVIVFFDPEVLYTRTQSPHKSLADALAHMKANRGKARWGASNPASLERIAMERLNRLAGVNAVVVSHEGGGDQVIGVLNGTYDLGIGEIQELRGQVEAKKLRLLAVLTENRLPGAFADLPTAREQGIDLVVSKFRGLAGPKKLPAGVLRAWEEGIQAVLGDPSYQKEYARDSLVPAFMDHHEAGRFTARFAEELAASLRELGLVR
jgi:tripartite-type tricarboxylate transporter receptor subunit TctC